MQAHGKLAEKFQLKKGYSVLDIGIAGDPRPSGWYNLWGRRANQDLYHTLDIDKRLEPTIVGDITKRTPIDDSTYDLVICSQTLEHLWDFRAAIAEIYRITRNVAIIDVPFVYKYHREPNDYWRFSKEAMHRLLEEAGFVNVEALWSNGERHTSIATGRKSKEWLK